MRTAIVSAVIAALAVAASSSATVRFDNCTSAKLRLRLSAQSAPTRTVVTLSMTDRGSDVCTVSGPVRFELLRAGKHAAVKGNPVAGLLSDYQLLPGEAQEVAHAWLTNWCASHSGISVRATYHGSTASFPLRVFPDCVNKARPTTFAAPTGP